MTAPERGWLIRRDIESYARVWGWQKRLVRARRAQQLTDGLILLEHWPVITIGRHGLEENILVDQGWLEAQGFEVHRVERAGDVTYHGPGQLIAYPILDLTPRGKDVRAFVFGMLESVIDLLADYGLGAQKGADHTGVYVGSQEICAFGARVSEWITWHGLAFNVNTNLEHFGLINPCGQATKEVTSLARLLGRPVPMAEAADAFLRHFQRRFGLALEPWAGELPDPGAAEAGESSGGQAGRRQPAPPTRTLAGPGRRSI